MKLYDYFRSSAAYRVRIALNLDGVFHQVVEVIHAILRHSERALGAPFDFGQKLSGGLAGPFPTRLRCRRLLFPF